jgi:hypothetical protein
MQCNYEKHASVQFGILSTASLHLYFVMTINFFVDGSRMDVHQQSSEPTFYGGTKNFFGDCCKIQEDRKHV